MNNDDRLLGRLKQFSISCNRCTKESKNRKIVSLNIIFVWAFVCWNIILATVGPSEKKSLTQVLSKKVMNPRLWYKSGFREFAIKTLLCFNLSYNRLFIEYLNWWLFSNCTWRWEIWNFYKNLKKIHEVYYIMYYTKCIFPILWQ